MNEDLLVGTMFMFVYLKNAHPSFGLFVCLLFYLFVICYFFFVIVYFVLRILLVILHVTCYCLSFVAVCPLLLFCLFLLIIYSSVYFLFFILFFIAYVIFRCYCCMCLLNCFEAHRHETRSASHVPQNLPHLLLLLLSLFL